MAKHKGDPGGGEKGTVKFMFFELSGSDSTLQEAVKTLQSAIARAIPSNGLPAAPVKKAGGLPPGTPAAEEQESSDLPDIDAETVSEADPIEPQVRREPRKYTLPTAIPIDTTEGLPFATFAAQFTLDNDQDRYVAMATWLKDHRDTSMKAGHVLTLYRHMGWTEQKDITMPLRRLVTKKFQWLERSARGDYDIAALGRDRLSKLKVSA